jgi:acyl-CoA reductase-like NAD-dependent aldehyde dehydrogenase
VLDFNKKTNKISRRSHGFRRKSYTDIDEAIRCANVGSFGLAASVWTTNFPLAHEIAARLMVGTVWINKHIDRTPHLPVAGAKHSGVGVELGALGLHEFPQIKVIKSSLSV